MPTVTLGEGHTPLVQSVRIASGLGLNRLFFKLENTNPSGSYKDRFAAAEVADVLASGGKGCLATSSGNTGSALAAFCARYNLPCVIVVGTNTPAGKLTQMQAHGARVLRVRDFLNSPLVAKMAFETLTDVAAELAEGKVAVAFPMSLSLDNAYYSVVPDAAMRRPEVVAFREWLLEEALKQAHPLGTRS